MGPLHGLKVVEMAGLAPGPFCAMMLADMGAEVLRIERPGFIPRGAEHVLLNRSRRAIVIDLKTDPGQRLMRQLLLRADAFIEGFRPGVMERLGFGPETCLALNPKLVYGRMTGWGQYGPLAQRAGHDINYISLSGVLHSIGRKGEAPTIPLNLVGDFGGGGMYLAFGIVCALLEAKGSGLGQVVDAAMIDGAASLMSYMMGAYASKEWSGARGDSVVDGSSPWYHVYETLDGRYVTVGAGEPQFYAELLRRTGLDLVPDLPAQHDRARWPELQSQFEKVFCTRTRDEWCTVMDGADACFAPVLNLQEAAQHPHNRARQTFVEIDGVLHAAPAPRFSRTQTRVPFAPIPPGTDDSAALANWGISAEEFIY